jgi:hypothetical protein
MTALPDGDFGPSAYPEDGITLLERWANRDPLNTRAVGAITTTVRLPLLFD